MQLDALDNGAKTIAVAGGHVGHERGHTGERIELGRC